jgi:hypothetical protein
MKDTVLLFVGAAVGGIIGYYGAVWMARQGFYALVLPGGLLGIGAALGKSKSIAPAILCCIAAIALGLFTDWRIEPFIKDASLGFYLKHLSDLMPVTFLMIAAGAALGFWLPFRRMERVPATSP